MNLVENYLCRNDIKDHLCRSYVHAIAAAAGFGYEYTNTDRDSIDVTFRGYGPIEGDGPQIKDSYKIEVQLKGTSRNLSCDERGFKYQVHEKNYRDLRSSADLPRLLIVLKLPVKLKGDPVWIPDWMDAENMVTFKGHAYWKNLLFEPDSAGSKLVHIPYCNTLTPVSLRRLMSIVSRDEALPDVLI